LNVHCAAWCGHDQYAIALDGKALFGLGKRAAIPEAMRARFSQIQPAGIQPHAQTAQRLIIASQKALQATRVAIGRTADDAGIDVSRLVGCDHLTGLAALVVGNREAISRFDADKDRTAAL